MGSDRRITGIWRRQITRALAMIRLRVLDSSKVLEKASFTPRRKELR
jgi:hypothetical protein